MAKRKKAQSKKSEAGFGNRLFYKEKSAEWLASRPQQEQEEIARALEKFRNIRDTYKVIHDYEQTTGLSYKEIMADVSTKRSIVQRLAAYDHINMFGEFLEGNNEEERAS